MIAVLARVDHPPGYGGFPGKDIHDQAVNTAAHGYSVILVKCRDWVDVRAVRDSVRSKKVTGVFGSEWWDTWYGGRFDLVAVVPMTYGEILDADAGAFEGFGRSYGDNRWLGITSAEELLGDKNDAN